MRVTLLLFGALAVSVARAQTSAAYLRTLGYAFRN
jgi:hypothetical protein